MTMTPEDQMRMHIVTQLAAAIDAAGAWVTPYECGKHVSELVGRHLPERGEREVPAGMISDVIAFVRRL